MDQWGASPFVLTRVLGAVFVLPAVGWLLIERRQFVDGPRAGGAAGTGPA
jgi:hypothetical protein